MPRPRRSEDTIVEIARLRYEQRLPQHEIARQMGLSVIKSRKSSSSNKYTLTQKSEERVRAERDLISRSVMVEVDPDGRIVLPPRVREKMGFAGDLAGEAEAAFAGFTNRFRLYRKEVYEAELAEDDEDDVDPLTLVGRHAASQNRRTG